MPSKPSARTRPRTGAANSAKADAGAKDNDGTPPKVVEKNYITPAGHRKLAQEFDFLRGTKRPEVVSALSDAAAEGDRSENAEYIYRKRQLRQIDGRLRFLAKRLDVTRSSSGPR
jgi:hypothetical protein